MRIERRSKLSVDEFIARYLVQNIPLIVSDAMEQWSKTNIWTIEFFADQFGHCNVQVYDDLFSLQSVCSLHAYLKSCWDTGKRMGQDIPYVRWYSRFKDVDFAWSDDAFGILATHWHTPYFLPTTNYLFPNYPPPAIANPVCHQFPGRGIFISGAGARTRRHVDPWCTDAVMCHVLGRKEVKLFSPQRRRIDGIPLQEYADRHVLSGAVLRGVCPMFEDTLQGGEVLYIPSGWPHQVTSVTDSISVTWNFVHDAHSREFRKYITSDMPRSDSEILRYFGSR